MCRYTCSFSGRGRASLPIALAVRLHRLTVDGVQEFIEEQLRNDVLMRDLAGGGLVRWRRLRQAIAFDQWVEYTKDSVDLKAKVCSGACLLGRRKGPRLANTSDGAMAGAYRTITDVFEGCFFAGADVQGMQQVFPRRTEESDDGAARTCPLDVD